MGEIRNKATLDTKPFNQGLKGMEGRVSSFASKLSMAYKAAGAAAAIGSMVRMGKAALTTADEIDNLSKQLQLGIESTQSLKVMFEEAGMSLSSMNTVVATAKNAQAEALNGTKQYAEAFDKLGISMDDLRRMNMEQVIESVSRAITQGGNSSDVTAASIDILGSRSTKLEGVLRQLGNEGFGELNKRMLETSQIMERDMVVAADKMEEGIERAIRRTKTAVKEDLSKRFLGFSADMAEVLGVLLEGESGYGAAYIQNITGMESAKLVNKEEREKKRAEEKQAAAEKMAQLEQEGKKLLEIRRFNNLSVEDQRKELIEKRNKLEADIASEKSQARKNELLKEAIELDKQIGRVKEDAEEKPTSELTKSLGQFERVGARMGAGANIVTPHEQRKINMQKQMLKTAEAQEKILREIANKREGSTF